MHLNTPIITPARVWLENTTNTNALVAPVDVEGIPEVDGENGYWRPPAVRTSQGDGHRETFNQVLLSVVGTNAANEAALIHVYQARQWLVDGVTRTFHMPLLRLTATLGTQATGALDETWADQLAIVSGAGYCNYLHYHWNGSAGIENGIGRLSCDFEGAPLLLFQAQCTTAASVNIAITTY